MNELATQTYNPPAGVESASTAMAAQAKAMVESRYVMAMRNPRNIDQVRLSLLKECHRPSFAHNKSTYYVKPIGKGVEGLGIRFVEVALRCMKNVLIETNMIFEDAEKEIHRVSVTDLESNITYPLDVRVSKTVERSKPMDDGSYISVRTNSYGKPVYTVTGTDDDILNKRGALISKAIRTLGLRIIPGDLCDEAEEIIKKIRLDETAKDPDAARKNLVDAFSEIGVSADDLTKYLGHEMAKCSPAQLVNLRGLYGAIKDGEATWQTVMQNKAEKAQDGSGDGMVTLPMSDEKFNASLKKWQEQVNKGGKVSDLLNMLKSRNSLTAEQEDAILSLKAVIENEPSLTAEQIEQKLNDAKDMDALYVAADLINQIKDAERTASLNTVFDERLIALKGGDV